jgi:zinc protease
VNRKLIAVVVLACAAMMLVSGDVCSQRDAIPTVLLPIPSSPLVTFRIQFRAGAVDDPAGKEGLTELAASTVAEGGTTQHTYQQITELLYPMASSVNVYVDKEVTTFVGTSHVENIEQFTSLLLEMLLEPRYDTADFERLKTNQINYLKKTLRGADDEELGKQTLYSFMYQGHPYGTPNEGLVSSVESITMDDVRRQRAALFTRDNVVLGLAGGYTPALLERVTRELGKLPVGSARPNIVPAPVAPIENFQVLAVEKDCVATAISIGFPIDITRASPDFYPLMIANSFLGEHRTFNGRLMVRMREVRGLNYGDYSYIEHFVQDGGSTFPLPNYTRSQQYFSIWIRPVQHAHRHFALRLAMWELDRLVRDGMTQEEFDRTRDFLNNYSKLWAQDQSRRLGYQMDSRFYGTDDFLATFPQKLDAVTLADVNAAIKRHLRADRACVGIVTKGADAFLRDLITNQASPMTYDAEDIPKDVLAEDAAVAVYQLNINREKSKIVDVEEMFK